MISIWGASIEMYYSHRARCRRVAVRLCQADKSVEQTCRKSALRARGPYRKRLTVTPCKLPNATFLTGPRRYPPIDLDAKLPETAPPRRRWGYLLLCFRIPSNNFILCLYSCRFFALVY